MKKKRDTASESLNRVTQAFANIDNPVPQKCGCINHNDGAITFCCLHAAAPELLEACKAALIVSHSCKKGDDILPASPEICTCCQIERAITRATKGDK